ncbi:MAG: metallophosphoesterase family protein [Smithellaceae bacterium]|nr:metallophosphoesterase family protein [Smithellaceae bacterium]
MKIGVISDTHLPGHDERLQKIIDEHFAGADCILHAGDIIDLGVLEMFGRRDVNAVHGNMDLPATKRALPRSLVVEVRGFRIGLIHGYGIEGPLEEGLLKIFGSIDCVVYGHTHQADNHRREEVLFFNPGSPVDKLFTKRNTVGIIEVGENIEGRIVEVDY